MAARPPGFDERARAIRRVLFVTLLLNAVVAAAKISYGVVADSLSIRADGFHSATDGINNIVLLLGSWLGARPPDREHPYGHKKLEVFAAALVGLGLLTVSVDVAKDVIARLAGTEPLPRIDAGAFAVLGGTLVVNVAVATWEGRAGRRLLSPGLLSDAAHTKSDVVVTLGVMVSAVLVRSGLVWIDAVAGSAVAGVIALTGVRIIKENAGYLMDTNLVDVEVVAKVARAVAGVTDARDVRSRGSPGGVFIDLTITVDGESTVRAAHAVADHVEDAVRAGFPGINGVQVHVEPA